MLGDDVAVNQVTFVSLNVHSTIIFSIFTACIFIELACVADHSRYSVLNFHVVAF